MHPLLKTPKTAHQYKPGASFQQVMMLYRFDKKLRMLIFNETEKIEIAIRRAVMQITAEMTGDPFWLTNPSYFLDNVKFQETMRVISAEYNKSREEFILHFKQTYSTPYPQDVNGLVNGMWLAMIGLCKYKKRLARFEHC